MIKYEKAYALIIILACLAFIPSCKKGCTDPNAINYVKGTRLDNATCLYCDSTVNLGIFTSNNFQDQNSSSPYFGQSVLQITVFSKVITYTGNACQQLGLVNSSCQPTNLYAIYGNLTPSHMVASGTLSLGGDAGAIWNFPVSSLSINPNSNDTLYLGSFSCTMEFFDFNFSNSTYQYH